MERVKGIEPSSQAWEARILPLNHTRFRGHACIRVAPVVQLRGFRDRLCSKQSNHSFKLIDALIDSCTRDSCRAGQTKPFATKRCHCATIDHSPSKVGIQTAPASSEITHQPANERIASARGINDSVQGKRWRNKHSAR